MSEIKDYIKEIAGAERRYAVNGMKVEKRDADGDKPAAYVVRGYAAKFNEITVIGNWFREEILTGAFDDCLADDIRALFNHDANLILARTASGTLEVGVDAVGFWYEYVTPNRQYALDLADAIERGDVSQSSFAFSAKETIWIEREGELDLRQIKKMERIYDVSPVTYPAYQNTTVGLRTHEAREADKKLKETEVRDARTADDKGLSLVDVQIIINQNL